jgi:hypothetical protein
VPDTQVGEQGRRETELVERRHLEVVRERAQAAIARFACRQAHLVGPRRELELADDRQPRLLQLRPHLRGQAQLDELLLLLALARVARGQRDEGFERVLEAAAA